MTWPELVTTGDWTRLHAVGNGLDCMVIVQYLVNPTYLARTSKARRAISPAPWIYQGRINDELKKKIRPFRKKS